MTINEPVVLHASMNTMLTARWVVGADIKSGKTNDWIELVSIKFGDNSNPDEVKVKVLRLSPTAQVMLTTMIDNRGQLIGDKERV